MARPLPLRGHHQRSQTPEQREVRGTPLALASRLSPLPPGSRADSANDFAEYRLAAHDQRSPVSNPCSWCHLPVMLLGRMRATRVARGVFSRRMSTATPDPFGHCSDTVKRGDYDGYLYSLLQGGQQRQGLVYIRFRQTFAACPSLITQTSRRSSVNDQRLVPAPCRLVGVYSRTLVASGSCRTRALHRARPWFLLIAHQLSRSVPPSYQRMFLRSTFDTPRWHENRAASVGVCRTAVHLCPLYRGGKSREKEVAAEVAASVSSGASWSLLYIQLVHAPQSRRACAAIRWRWRLVVAAKGCGQYRHLLLDLPYILFSCGPSFDLTCMHTK